jgi:hypothetical protein
VDVCTRKNFSESVRTHSCETGCETVTVFDKNGKFISLLSSATVDFFLWGDCLLGWSTISLFEYYYTRQPTIIHDCLRLGVVTGRLDFFYRNCAANTSSITGTCVNETSKAITKVCPSTSHGVNHHSIICVIPLFYLSFQQEICNCDSNYCNQSSGGLQQQLGVVLSGILALLMIQF